jgi:hypothetical protein
MRRDVIRFTCDGCGHVCDVTEVDLKVQASETRTFTANHPRGWYSALVNVQNQHDKGDGVNALFAKKDSYLEATCCCRACLVKVLSGAVDAVAGAA